MKGEFIHLQRLTEEDHELLARWAASDAGVYGQGTPQFYSREDVRQSVEHGGQHYLMVVTLDGRKVGAVNWSSMLYEGSYLVGGGVGDEDLWSQGYGVEAVLVLLEYLFHAKNAHRVQMVTGLYNKRMMQIVSQGYMVVEGVLRDYFFLDGAYHDAISCSLLRDEYYALAASSEFGSVRDVIPADDKAAARKMFLEYLDARPGDHLRRLVDREWSA